MIKDTNNNIYYQYALDSKLEQDLKELKSKRLSPAAKQIQKEILLDDYCKRSALLRGKK
jgi:hypothetical protein